MALFATLAMHSVLPIIGRLRLSSNPITRRGVRPARQSQTGSMASSFTWRTMMSCFGRCRVRRSRSCRSTSSGWVGGFHGRLRSAATSTSTSTSRLPRSNSVKGPSNTTTSAAATRWTRHRSLSQSSTLRPHAEPTHQRFLAICRA